MAAAVAGPATFTLEAEITADSYERNSKNLWACLENVLVPWKDESPVFFNDHAWRKNEAHASLELMLGTGGTWDPHGEADGHPGRFNFSDKEGVAVPVSELREGLAPSCFPLHVTYTAPKYEALDRVVVGSERHQPSVAQWRLGIVMVSRKGPLEVRVDGSLFQTQGVSWNERVRLLRTKAEIRVAVEAVEPVTERPAFLPKSGPKQMDVPPQNWAMTRRQFNQFVDWCKTTSTYSQVKKIKGYVSLYELNNLFVKPLTRGVGASIALLMNADKPLAAALMLSHAWGEDVEECQEAVNIGCTTRAIADDTPLWFCLFANYQPGGEEGDCGPSVGDQLELDPFGKVIESVETAKPGMLAIHTSLEDLYDRLWCVYEVDVALSRGVAISGVGSKKLIEMSWMKQNDIGEVSTIEAHCGWPSDEEMIRKQVMCKEGGFVRLDAAINKFRKELQYDLNYSVQMDCMLDKLKQNLGYRPGPNAKEFDLVVSAMADLQAVDVQLKERSLSMNSQAVAAFMTITKSNGDVFNPAAGAPPQESDLPMTVRFSDAEVLEKAQAFATIEAKQQCKLRRDFQGLDAEDEAAVAEQRQILEWFREHKLS